MSSYQLKLVIDQNIHRDAGQLRVTEQDQQITFADSASYCDMRAAPNRFAIVYENRLPVDSL